MSPNFENNDRVLVIKHNSLSRYDVITFSPEEAGMKYVKRLIGLPGDQLWVDNNAVYIRPKEAGKWDPGDNEVVEVNQLPDSTLKISVSEEVARNLDGVDEIPKNKYFVLGDNRKNSRDSRALGFIDKEQIEGVVLLKYYPLFD